MTSAPRVTVLMTVYNGLPYLQQAIESVLQQTFQEFELLIIDDASTDESVACVRAFNDPRIHLVCHERNLGQATSLNEGLALACGAYVARLDQDDVCLPDRLRRQVIVLDQQPDIAVVGTWMYRVDDASKKTGVLGMRVGDDGAFVSWLLTTASPLGHPTVMYRRDLTIDAGGYDPTFAPCEDYELWCRLAIRRCRARVIPEPLVMLRVHSRQQSVTRIALQQQNVRRAHERFVATFCRNGQERLLSLLFQMNDAFWDTCGSSHEVRAVLQGVQEMLTTMRHELGLGRREYRTLQQGVCWWFGRRAFVAIVRQRRQSFPVYLFAWRGGVKVWVSLAMLLYLPCYFFSPLFVPTVHESLLRWARRLHQQRDVVRLLRARPTL